LPGTPFAVRDSRPHGVRGVSNRRPSKTETWKRFSSLTRVEGHESSEMMKKYLISCGKTQACGKIQAAT
jgi:hypothetical protein